MRIAIISVQFFLLFFGAFAQNTTQNSKCCQEEYQQFNFWLGDWDVYDQQGKQVGESHIVALQDGYVLQENWITTGNTGTSYNYFDKKDKTWNQVYIDNGGNALVLKGTFADDKMVLKSEKVKGDKGDYYNRISWFKDSLGNVSQVWDIVDVDDNVLQVAFDGLYKPKP